MVWVFAVIVIWFVCLCIIQWLSIEKGRLKLRWFVSHFLVEFHLRIQEHEVIWLVGNGDKRHKVCESPPQCASLPYGINRCSHKDNTN